MCSSAVLDPFEIVWFGELDVSSANNTAFKKALDKHR